MASSIRLFGAHARAQRSRRLLSLVVVVATVAAGFFPIQPAAAAGDTVPPSPTNPHWSDSAGLLTETVSGNTTIQASWAVFADGTGGSGMAQYRVQLSEVPDVSGLVTDPWV